MSVKPVTSFETASYKKYRNVIVGGRRLLDEKGEPTAECLQIARNPQGLLQVRDNMNFWPDADKRTHRVAVYNAIVEALPEELQKLQPVPSNSRA